MRDCEPVKTIAIEVVWQGKVTRTVRIEEGWRAKQELSAILIGMELDPGLTINIKE